MTKSIPKIWAILPAAGAGKRFSTQKPKQFFELNGQLVAEHSLRRLRAVPQIETSLSPAISTPPGGHRSHLFSNQM